MSVIIISLFIILIFESCFNENVVVCVKVTDWSVWSPCSRTCGAGVTTQSRLLMNAPDDPSTQLCLSKVQLTRSKPCEEIANCTFDAATAKGES